MPKSKRNRQITLSKTRKKGLEMKQHLIEEIQKNVDSYARIVLFSVCNMRNNVLTDVRKIWRHSRFFFGKNRVMARALGKTPEEEYRDNLHKISERLKGQCGLLFTNSSKDEILRWFETFYVTDFARTGSIAEETVNLDEGPLKQFSHSIEPHLRQLGMPTALQKGVVTLIKDFQVCKEGDILTPEQAQILKLLGNHTVQFKMIVHCIWTNNGEFENLKNDTIDNGKEEKVEEEGEEEEDDEEEEISD